MALVLVEFPFFRRVRRHVTHVVPGDGFLIRTWCDGSRSIYCLRCGLDSWHPQDIAHAYCGRCQVFHEDVAWAEEFARLPP